MLFLLFLIPIAFAEPTPLPAARVLGSDGATIELASMQVGMVGNTRDGTTVVGRTTGQTANGNKAVMGDIMATKMTSGLDAIFLLGDMVGAGTPSGWERFAEGHAAVIDGTMIPPSPVQRSPVLPVVGDRDCIKDPGCARLAKVFPGYGVEIGFGRTATWHHVDLRIGETDRWRVIVLDSNKKGLGSRWSEQVAWLKRTVKEPGNGLLVLLHEPPVTTATKIKNEGAKALMDVINEHAPLLSLRAVFSAGPANQQAFLPEGALGPLFVNAGGGGWRGDMLERGMKGSTEEPRLIDGLQSGLNAVVDSHLFNPEPPDPKAVDEALGSGTFEGFPRRIDPKVFPMNGWWKMSLNPGEIRVAWRGQKGDGVMYSLASLRWSESTGWTEAD